MQYLGLMEISSLNENPEEACKEFGDIMAEGYILPSIEATQVNKTYIQVG